MRKTKEILRLRWQQGLSVRDTSKSVGVSTGVIDKTVCRARSAGLTWEAIEGLEEDELEVRLYGTGPKKPGAARPMPDPLHMHKELRKQGVTLELLHLEYLEEHPDGYRYTAFCDVYRRWLALRPLSMRQVHKAGEKTFVDYSGKKPSIVDPQTGEVIEVELFVGALGASNYTFAEATRTQRTEDFLGSHVRMVEFFGGVTAVYVPDQLKSAVKEPSRYEPGITRGYADWARHYGTAIVPARPRKPKDKAKVEVAVQVAQRWILARLRHETFFSLTDLNARIRELLIELNERPMRGYGGATRRELFERLDQPALRALAETRFEVSDWSSARVSRDYHVQLEKHWYSVPYALVGERVEARLTTTTVELFFRGRRVAAHVRSREPYKHTTDPGHMPPKHRHAQDGVESVVAWAKSVGPMTATLVERILDANPYREQGWRSARGLQRIGEKHGPERTEAACAKALAFGARSYKPVERILRLGRETTPSDDTEPTDSGITHENVRGPDYYH
ncbi:MAG: IS21 family transposase [Myxococcales bacterium]|nr:IS21 family transposase [Myxococcales bacterium]